MPICSKNRQYLSQEITVCSECLQASCWQGAFFCEKATHASTKRLTRKDLFEIATGEHPSYWKTDAEVAARG